MNIEYASYDIAASEAEIASNITAALKFYPDVISVFNPYIKIAKNLCIAGTKISSPIDFPLGILDLKSRLGATEAAIKQGVDIVDIVCPAYFLCNRKYDKLREDIKQMLMLCSSYNIELRYVLEYRQYSYELLYKVAQILIDFGVNTIYPSTGYLLDDINDNILAAGLINKKVPSINIICNGNFWNDQQSKVIKKAQLYSIRANSLNSLALLRSK